MPRFRKPSVQSDATDLATVPSNRFWERAHSDGAAPEVARAAFSDLVFRIERSPDIVLFEAIEVGLPASLVDLIARVLHQPVSRVIAMLGVSTTTLRRKELAREPLPELAGHRIMSLLRIEAVGVASFDFEGWFGAWLSRSRPELGGRAPAHLLRNPEGLRVVEQLVERMSGGLPA